MGFIKTMTSMGSIDTAIQELSVLVIEDDSADFFLTKEQLLKIEGINLSIDQAHNLNESLYFIDRNQYDVVLIDYYLGALTGMDILESFYEKNIQIPTIILTGVWSREIDMAAIRKGASDYLVKSEITPSLLDRSIRYAIERKQANEKLEKMARVDPLTQLLNRRGLEDILSIEIERIKRSADNPIIILIDLDDFKEINDTFGYSVGDVVLKEMAHNLKKILRPTDYAARIGGDEFMIVLPETRFAEGLNISERIRLSLAESTIELATETISVTVSIGLMAASSKTLSIDSLLSELHVALKESKRSGKNSISIAGVGQQTKLDCTSTTLKSLQSGEGIYCVSQPIIELDNNQLAGYEILSRNASSSFKTPVDFFRLSMENNILTTVDLHCIKKGLEKLNGLESPTVIHFNIFPSTILSSFSQMFIDELVRHRGENRICLEISEQQLIGDPSYLKESIESFKDSGIMISIDDVGFGKSSLESLIFLEPDIIKIDKRCVMNVSKDNNKLRYLKRLIAVANSLNIEVIAEGIETQEDLNSLVRLGVKYGQGFLFGKPEKVFANQESVNRRLA